MRAVVQRVSLAKVSVNCNIIGEISSGLLVYVGIQSDDNTKDISYIVDKVINLRVFNDEKGNMNLSALDLEKEILVISQFTLYGDCRKGRRPSFNQSMASYSARHFFETTLTSFRNSGLKIETGEFQAHMDVESIVDGPVTILLDSKKQF